MPSLLTMVVVARIMPNDRKESSVCKRVLTTSIGTVIPWLKVEEMPPEMKYLIASFEIGNVAKESCKSIVICDRIHCPIHLLRQICTCRFVQSSGVKGRFRAEICVLTLQQDDDENANALQGTAINATRWIKCIFSSC
jgi:hypothetical protein